jgi:hypothetical protein
MSMTNPDRHDDAVVPDQAVRGLDEATRRAREAGRPVVVVRDGQLVRLGAGEPVVLKQLPARRKVAVRRKVAKP